MSRIVRAIVAALALATGVLGVCLVLMGDEPSVDPDVASPSESVAVPAPMGEATTLDLDNLHLRSLNEDEQAVYLALYQGIVEQGQSFAIAASNADDIEAALHALRRDHPELFWLSGACTYQEQLLGDVLVELDYDVDPSAIPSAQATIDAAVAAFRAGLAPDATTYDKVRAAYEWVIERTDYGDDSPQNQNIQSVFVDHVSMCAGYAKAFQYLLRQVGVPCAYVQGTIEDGREHAWNLVDVDGTLTYVDPTWGDPVYAGLTGDDVPASVTYDYLCLTTEEMGRIGHVAAAWPILPDCTSEAYDYYRLNGRYLDAYDQGRVDELFRDAFEAGRDGLSFKLASDEAYEQALAALEDGSMLDGSFAELASARQGSPGIVRYRTARDDGLRVVTLFW